MIITTELAQPIVKQMMGVVDYNINIMNHDGVIVASGDSKRINQTHQGAREAIELKRERIIYVSDYRRMFGTQPGVNLPIEFNGGVIGAVGITGDPTKIYKLVHIVKITVEALLQQQYLSDQLRYKQKALEEWVFDLINPDFNNLSELEARSHFLKINTKSLSAVCLIQVEGISEDSGDYERVQQQEARVLQLLNFFRPDSLFSVHIGKGRFILAVPVSQTNDMDEALVIARQIHQKLSSDNWLNFIGIGFSYRGIEGYRLSFVEALQSLKILSKVNPEKGIAHFCEWGVLQLVAQIPEEIRRAYISRFLGDKKPLDSELLDTLESFLNDNQNIQLTSSKLHIHRNTLMYRLDKIKQLWGLDPRNFHDALKLQLLCWCEKLT